MRIIEKETWPCSQKVLGWVFLETDKLLAVSALMLLNKLPKCLLSLQEKGIHLLHFSIYLHFGVCGKSLPLMYFLRQDF